MRTWTSPKNKPNLFIIVEAVQTEQGPRVASVSTRRTLDSAITLATKLAKAHGHRGGRTSAGLTYDVVIIDAIVGKQKLWTSAEAS